jgi:hypothetical protein
VAEGATIFGCAIGRDGWVTLRTGDRISEYSEILRPVMSLPPQTTFAILQCAVNARLAYTARTTLPALVVGASAFLNANIDSPRLAAFSSTNLPRHAQLIRALP